MNKKIAIIGSSIGQRPLYIKAKENGFHTIGFAWDKGAICKDITDTFYPISITEMDLITEKCKEEQVIGVIANGSTRTVEVANYVAEKLGLDCTPYEIIQNIKNKAYVRMKSKCVEELSLVRNYLYDKEEPKFLPCIVKPITGGSKKGVSFVSTLDTFQDAIKYSESYYDIPIMIEEYIGGIEVSVESISYRGNHYVIQITDKENSGAPHFVELAHHQPSRLSIEIKNKIKRIIPRLLDSVGFVSGATHIELKITEKGDVYLIEINPRGGGDRISTDLVYLSTGYDYIKAMIDVAIGEFKEPNICDIHYSGIYFLTKQTEHLLDFFKKANTKKWFVEGEISSYDLKECFGNNLNNGYLIYQYDKKIELDD